MIAWFLCGALLTGCAGMLRSVAYGPDNATALDRVRLHLFCERNDLTLSPISDVREPFFTGTTQRLLDRPLALKPLRRQVSSVLLRKNAGFAAAAEVAGMLLELDTAELARAEVPAGELPAGLPEELSGLYAAMAQAWDRYRRAFERLSADEALFVKQQLELSLFSNDSNEGTRWERQSNLERAFGIAARIDLQQIAAALYLIVASLEMDLQDLRDVAGNSDEVLSIETPLGNIIIGSPGDDVYTGPAPALLIEAGGDDLYRFQEPSRLCVIIDLAGEDTYACADQVFLGAGIGGIGVLVDCAGDDRYIGGSFSFGSGFLGAGMLADLDGDDRYVARMFCQGAASFGIGVLYDGAGKDAYSCGLYGQGMGAVAGAGVLVDMDGDDDYRSGYEVADLREKNKGFQTYSQGFATGVRQFAGGGVGLLFDGRGDDRYSGSYFCQGSSYWHALGLLIDEQGDDSYQARRYSQGAGVHASVGALFDGSGDDAYLSWGVSQGCGHDAAVGLLYDSRGSDRYESGWLSQAAGSSMGIGLLVDDGGDDSYEAGSGSAVQGGGAYDERRDGISLGMLVDRAGRDLFSSLPDRQALWRRGGRGGGIDAGGNRPSVWNYARSADGEPDSPEQQEEQELPAPVRVLDALEAPLLLEASWKQAAEKLVAQGPEIIPALCGYLAIKDVSVQRAIEETLKAFADEHLEAIHAYVLRGDTRPRIQRYVLFVLGEIGDNASAEVFLRFLGAEQERVQAMALRGCARLGVQVPDTLLAAFGAGTRRSLRRYLALALESSGSSPALQALCRLLADRDLQVRHAAYSVLQHKGKRAQPFLKALQQQPELLPSIRAMIRELLKERER